MLLIHIFLCLLFRNTSISLVDATVIPQESTLSFSTCNSTVEDTALSNPRSITGIVWSCLTTIFLCTWVAVHPDIPGDYQSDWKVLLHRFQMMCWSIMFPELVIAHAVRQFWAARDLFKKYKKTDDGWSMKHAHFERMGGFRKVGGHLTSTQITKDEIQDRSKADGLSKIILVTQSLWFVVQCIGRRVKGLELSPLEVTTLAVTVCTFMLSIIWWDKPFDVRKPHRFDGALLIHPRSSSFDTLPLEQIETFRSFMLQREQTETPPPYSLNVPSEEDITDSGFSYVTDAELPEYGPLGSPPLGIPISVGNRGIAAVDPYRPSPNICKRVLVNFVQTFQSLIEASVNIMAHACIKTFKLFTKALPELSHIKIVLSPITHAFYKTTWLLNRVSGFSLLFEDGIAYPHSSQGGLEMRLLRIFGIPVTGATIFGLVHCISWNSYFPSITERTLWRISSVAVSALMITTACAYRLVFSSRSIRTYPFEIIRVAAALYIVARCYLLTEGIISLRNLPPSALEALNWPDFLPHIS